MGGHDRRNAAAHRQCDGVADGGNRTVWIDVRGARTHRRSDVHGVPMAEEP